LCQKIKCEVALALLLAQMVTGIAASELHGDGTRFWLSLRPPGWRKDAAYNGRLQKLLCVRVPVSY
jgi:hypothetical protein